MVRGAQTVPAFAQESVTFTFRTGATVSVTLPAVTGGEGGLTYALGSLALPTGLTYTAPGSTDTHGGTITGAAPATAQASTAYTLTVTDGDGDSAQESATLTHTASGGDYQGLSADLPVTVSDNDATPDVNADGTLDTEDVLVMYYTYTALNLLEDASIGERLRRLVFQPLPARLTARRRRRLQGHAQRRQGPRQRLRRRLDAGAGASPLTAPPQTAESRRSSSSRSPAGFAGAGPPRPPPRRPHPPRRSSHLALQAHPRIGKD